MVDFPQDDSENKFNSFSEFYLFYLSEHQNRISRRLHFSGTLLVMVLLVLSALFQMPWLLVMLPVVGYGFAWVGHFVFEKNRPATFRHPFYSLMGDFVMFKEMLTGKITF
ncbi:MAG: DUF962 domain-containing protein [Planctomycetaceae bacterium]|nr:DUF962 domain-containing protein [Planctomycetaceae bacterium]